jgi:HSP20 family protein
MATQVQKTNAPSPRRSIGSRQSLAPRQAYTPQGWEPFHEMERFNDQFQRLIESVWPQEGPGTNAGSWIPTADVEETDDAWIVEAELPSVKRDDINVELRDSELVITGEIKEKERKGVLRRRTRRTGEFEYRLTLPRAADPEKVEAKLHDGVLSVRVPKASNEKARRIEVKA